MEWRKAKIYILKNDWVRVPDFTKLRWIMAIEVKVEHILQEKEKQTRDTSINALPLSLEGEKRLLQRDRLYESGIMLCIYQ